MDLKNERIVEIGGILTGKIRVSIIRKLLQGPGIVTDIVDELQLNQAVVSKQLGILKNYGIIKCCPSGRCREYCISDPEMMRTLLDSMNKMAEICEKTAKLQNREINGGKNA